MNPLKFPDPRVEARRRAAEFQQLSSSERWAELAAMMAFGWKMVASSPQRDAIERRMADQEAAAQRIQKELFQRHGRKSDLSVELLEAGLATCESLLDIRLATQRAPRRDFSLLIHCAPTAK